MGESGFVLMGRAVLSKSLMQFSINGHACVPFLLFGLRPNYSRGNGSNGNLLQKDFFLHFFYSVPLTPQQATVDPRLCWRLLDTHRQVWLSLLWGHCSFLLGPGAHKVLFVLSKSLFPQFCGSSVIKSHWPPKANSLGVSVPLPDPQVVGPKTFLTV